MAILFDQAPIRCRIDTNYLDQVIIRFDFPVVLGIATTDDHGDLITARQSKILEQVQTELGPRLPNYKQVAAGNLELDIADPTNPKVRHLKNTTVHQFSSLDNSQLCEITAEWFVYAVKGGARYSTFENFLEEFWKTWELVSTVLKVRLINKVGLRKVNLFDVTLDPASDLRGKIKKEFLPPISIGNPNLMPEFSARQIVTMPGKTWNCISQYGFRQKHESRNNLPAYFFDNDIQMSGPKLPTDIKTEVTAMNELLWELFWNSMEPEFYNGLAKRKE